MALIDHIDADNRRIYLSEDTKDTAWHPYTLYAELRVLRKTDEELRKYDNFMRGAGNINKGGGKATERYFTLLDGARIVPYDASHIIDITGTIITDDGLEGAFCFDKTPLSDGVSVDIQYSPKQVEVINLNFDDLVYSSFQGAVWVDVVNGAASKGTDTMPNGNTARPVNSMQLAVEIAKERGFRRLEVIGDITLGEGDDVTEFHVNGISHVHAAIEVLDACVCTRTQFSSFKISGKLDGDSEIVDCVVGDLTYFNGHIHNCMIDGVITLDGDSNAVIDNCAMLNILRPATIDCNGSNQNLVMTNWGGQLEVVNSGVGNNLGIGCSAAEVIIHDSCIDGIIAISGAGAVTDNSGDDCYVIDKTVDGSEMQNLKVLIEQLRPHHTGGGSMIFWDPTNGSDYHHGDAANRGFKTFAKCHDTVRDAAHDTIVIVPGNPGEPTIITEKVEVTKDYLFIRGPGRDVIFQVSDDEPCALSTSARGTEFSGFRVQHSATDGNGIHSTGMFTLVSNVWFENCTNGVLFEANHPVVDNARFYKPTGYGIRFDGATFGGEVIDCSVGHAGTNAIEVNTTEGAGGIKMSNTMVIGADKYGIALSDTSSGFVLGEGNVFSGNKLGDYEDLGTGNVLKDSEAAIHTALDGYNNKEDWKGLTTVQEDHLMQLENTDLTATVEASAEVQDKLSELSSTIANVATASDVINASQY